MKRLEKINKIKLHPDNPRIIKDVKFDLLVKSITEFPEMLEKRPLVVNEELQVLGGNMRLKAAQQAGMTEIWIDEAKGWSKEKQNEFIIKDNSGFGEWDWDELANAWDVEDLNDWGLDLPPMFDEPEPEATEDDYTEPDNMQVDVVLGDLIEIGEHRLLCGDSTDSDQVAKLMDGEKADIAFTSPPYNAGKNGHLNGKVKGFDEKYQNKNDAKTDDEYLKFLYDFTINTTSYSNYSFVNIQMLAQNKFGLIDYQYKLKKFLKDILIWNKSTCPPNIVKGAFNTKWEYIFCFSKKNETRGFPCKWQGKFPNVIETENASGNKFASIHKATFPISFPAWIIEKMDFSKSVLDVFMGTGTTMVAAHQLKRKCYGMELDPKYCQVIIDRMQKLDSQLEIKINNKIYEKTEYVL